MLSVVLFVACSAKEESAEPRKTIRVAEYPADFSEKQRAYEERKEMQEATKWGQAEAEGWEQRYRDHEDPYTYQGNVK